MNTESKTMPPPNCRQKLAADGMPYPRSSCAVCGQLSPRWKECDALIDAAPVPPAGDVEVLACASFGKSGNIQCWSLQRDHASLRKLEGEGQTVIDLVDRAHATRLQAEVSALQQRLNIADQRVCDLTAERDGLLAEAERRGRCYTTEKNLRQETQSELTKARELLKTIRNVHPSYARDRIDEYLTAHQSAPAANFIACNVDESCGQDAEAAKGGA